VNRAVAALALLCACGKPEDTDTGDSNGQCGDVTTWDVTIAGAVEDASGPVGGAAVRLEDRAWNTDDVLGEATTEVDGSFSLDAKSVTSVEGCWGTVLDYRIVAEEGGRTGETKVNSALFDAIDSGSLEADISDFPILIE
jgi:hypothetical protein